MNSQTEENYLKAIFYLTYQVENWASTTALAERLKTKASSITDMVQKLAEKGFVDYKKYQGVRLTVNGKKIALGIIRKHRLWEVFLVDKLDFKWDEVHEIAEQLEHIQSKDLTDRLDAFLDFPKFDPHGDPIPDKDGNLVEHAQSISLDNLQKAERGIVVGVNDSNDHFLRFLDEHALVLGVKLTVLDIFPYDGSVRIKVGKEEKSLSHKVAKNLFVQRAS